MDGITSQTIKTVDVALSAVTVHLYAAADSRRARLPSPEIHGIVNPALGNSPYAKSKAVRQPVVDMELRWDAKSGKLLQSVLHSPPRGYTIARSHARISRRIILADSRIACILHYYSFCLRYIRPSGQLP